MLLVSSSEDLWKIFILPYVGLINSRFHIFQSSNLLSPNIFFCFSNNQGAVFFFFLLISLASSVLQWHHEEGNFFSEYDRSNWLFYVGYYLEVSSSLLYVQELVHQLLCSRNNGHWHSIKIIYADGYRILSLLRHPRLHQELEVKQKPFPVKCPRDRKLCSRN